MKGITLSQAAVIAGVAYLVNPVIYAEFKLYPALVVVGNPAQTVHNIQATGNAFGVALLCYLINYILDIVIAWALYVLLAPVNNALSLLAAVFRWMYTAMGLVGVLQLAMVFSLAHGKHYLAAVGVNQLQAQVEFLVEAHRFGWQVSLIVFGVHLVLLGYLLYRSSYVLYRSNFIPKVLGALIALDGLGWVISGLKPYLFQNANTSWFFVVSFVELLLPLWLVITGWRITLRGDAGHASTSSA